MNVTTLPAQMGPVANIGLAAGIPADGVTNVVTAVLAPQPLLAVHTTVAVPDPTVRLRVSVVVVGVPVQPVPVTVHVKLVAPSDVAS